LSTAPLDLASTYALIESGCCVLDSGIDAVLVRGRDATSWLQGQVSQDIAPLAPGQSAETLVLSPQGKIDAFCGVTVFGPEEVLLHVAAGYGPALAERLGRFRLRVKVELEVGSLRCLVMRGPTSGAVLEDAGLALEPSDGPPEGGFGGDWLIAVPARWPGHEGYDILAPRGRNPWPPLEAPFGDPEAFEASRIEAGIPAMGREINEKTIPQEAGHLVDHTVSFTKGCYTGQELVARLDARGGNVARRLRGVVLAPDSSGAELVPGAVLSHEGRELGRLTSVAPSPGFEAPVALAYVRRDVVPPFVATGEAGGSAAEIRELPLAIS
jgi:tRNA-modifying protein YgfZ